MIGSKFGVFGDEETELLSEAQGNSPSQSGGAPGAGQPSPGDVQPGEVEYQRQRAAKYKWQSRTASFMILAVVLILAGLVFRPLLSLAVASLVVSFYCLGRYFWHTQKLAKALPLARGYVRPQSWVINIALRWPIPIIFVLAVLIFAVPIFIYALTGNKL